MENLGAARSLYQLKLHHCQRPGLRTSICWPLLFKSKNLVRDLLYTISWRQREACLLAENVQAEQHLQRFARSPWRLIYVSTNSPVPHNNMRRKTTSGC